ncbi:carboxylesterase/lipase family protein [Paenibacillus sp. CN-4]|uniref:carboxylesterase/lipase family protein n=1 Tax=Paenibacillus nanchangensis TaxID=3348343 RepID=UPI00397B878F
MDNLVIQTANGLLRGMEEKGVHVWKGVPYAQPPVGPRRFRAPGPPADWSGIRDAFSFGPISLQTGVSTSGRFGGEGPEESEDCLYLNVWSPAGEPRDGQDAAKGRPVMVWIHGGVFERGAGSEAMYDGANLAAFGDVVVVTLNYRLGPFGFLHLAPLGGGLTSNQGLLDQVAALQWVRRNIAAFGGDPERVTVFGESAGGMSIAALLAMPAARGLFARAILQSGASQALSAEQSSAIAGALLGELGIAPGDTVALETLPASEIIEAAQRMNVRLSGGSLSMFFQPVVEPGTLPVEPETAVAQGVAAGIPLLIGTNHDEGNLFFREGSAVPQFEQSLAALRMLTGLQNVGELASGYDKSWEGQAEIMTDLFFWRSAVALAESQVPHGPVWMYRFDWNMPGHPLLYKAVHGAEIVFAFGNLAELQRLGVTPDAAAQRLSSQMMAAWTAFARSGEPRADELDWPNYDTESRITMLFDRDTHPVSDPDPEKRRKLFQYS